MIRCSVWSFSTRSMCSGLGVRQGKTGLKMGLVGLPNVGKTTLYNALTRQSMPAENFPFCTIDPATSRVLVPDLRLDALNAYYKPKSCKPAHLSVTDIAGLVKGAHKGKGLGNAFLSHISAVDGIYQVVRAFESNTIAHVEGGMDVIRDAEIIAEELRLKDSELLEKKYAKIKNQKAKGDPQNETIIQLVEILNSGGLAQSKSWKATEVNIINTLGLLTAKPFIYLLNCSEEQYLSKNFPAQTLLSDWLTQKKLNAEVIPFCGELEDMVVSMGDQAESWIQETKFESALPKIIQAGYSRLNLQEFFTVGEEEVRAWPFIKGSLAPDAAGIIHTDFTDAFQAVEVVKYSEFLEHREQNPTFKPLKFAKFGRKYVVEDGDIVQFVTGKKK